MLSIIKLKNNCDFDFKNGVWFHEYDIVWFVDLYVL